jgi:hypothetical protein
MERRTVRRIVDGIELDARPVATLSGRSGGDPTEVSRDPGSRDQ